MYKFAIVSIFLATIHCLPVPAIDGTVTNWLAELSLQERVQLQEHGFVERTPANYRGLGLLPPGALRERVYAEAGEVAPNVLSERLILVSGSATDDDVRAIFNLFYAPTRLSYLRYYNVVKDIDHDLFRECFLTGGPDDRTRRPDSPVTAIPESGHLWVQQGLPPFGDVLQEFVFERMGRGFLFVSSNYDSLSYHDVRVLNKGDMITVIAVIPDGARTIVYALGGARVRPVFSFLGGDRIENSFSSRNAGLFDYLNETFLKPLESRP